MAPHPQTLPTVGLPCKLITMPTTLIARQRVGGAAATLFLWLLGGAMGSGYNLGRNLTMGPNMYFTQNVPSILSLAFLCTSKGMYPIKTERPMYRSACDASAGLSGYRQHPMQCILEVGEKEGASPLTLSGGSTRMGLLNDWSIGCIEPILLP